MNITNRTVTVWTQKGSVLVVTERSGSFSLVAEQLENELLQPYEGQVFAIEKPTPWLPRITESFMLYGKEGTPFEAGLFTEHVNSFEVISELPATE